MIREILDSEAVRAVYGTVVAVVVALSASGVIDQNVVDVVIEAGTILGLGEFTRSQVVSKQTHRRQISTK